LCGLFNAIVDLNFDADLFEQEELIIVDFDDLIEELRS